MSSTSTSATATDLGFTSLDGEVDVEALPLEGTLPPWLAGTLLRNGPARFSVGPDSYRHWFDGLAMLHRFTIGDGRVAYKNRFLRSPAFEEAERTGRIARSEFATDPHRTVIERVSAVFAGAKATESGNANVNVVPFADAYLALTETIAPVAFDGETLATRGPLSYDDDVAGQMSTAHPHHDAARRATFNVVTELGRTSRYTIVRIEDGTLRRSPVASIATDEPAYLHAFSTTDRYVVLVECPFVVKPLDLVLRRKPFIDNYAWKPDRGTRFHIVDKDTGAKIGTFQGEPFFAFHHVNAFEENETIVLDVCAYPDAGIVHDLMLERLRGGTAAVPRGAFRRYRLVPGRRSVERENDVVATLELPRIAASRAARSYRFAYGVDGAADRADVAARLVKVDIASRSVAEWRADGAHPGEPVFVARPGGTDEDDGVLLSVVLDATVGTSYLLVLDARTLALRARAHLPHHVPYGFHGMFAGLS
jgi:beta,beta-carotene 9',10'-dioxygenase